MTRDHFLQGATCNTLKGPPAITVFSSEGGSSGKDPRCFAEGRCLAHPEGRNAVSRSLPAWLLRDRPFSGPPGGAALAAYLR